MPVTLYGLIRDAIAAAVRDCDHPDRGGPIYGPTRACPDCSTAAVLRLLPTHDAERERITDNDCPDCECCSRRSCDLKHCASGSCPCTEY